MRNYLRKVSEITDFDIKHGNFSQSKLVAPDEFKSPPTLHIVTSCYGKRCNREVGKCIEGLVVMAQVLKMIFNSRIVLAILVAFSTTWAGARSLSDLDAVNQSAWQRVLSMRIAKAYTQMAAGVDAEAAKLDLDQSIAEFDHILSQLELNSPNSKLHNRINKIKGEWKTFRELAESKPAKANVENVLENANDLLYQADALVREWKTRLPQSYGDSIDLAMQQSMLSERIGAYYVAQYLGIAQTWMTRELEYAIVAYEDGMVAIRQDGEQGNVPAQLMSQLNSNWEYAKMGLSQFQKGHFVPVVITVTMESMYEQTNILGAAYHVQERLAMNNVIGKSGLAANVSE